MCVVTIKRWKKCKWTFKAFHKIYDNLCFIKTQTFKNNLSHKTDTRAYAGSGDIIKMTEIENDANLFVVVYNRD